MYVECLETLAEFLSPSYLPLYEKALESLRRIGAVDSENYATTLINFLEFLLS